MKTDELQNFIDDITNLKKYNNEAFTKIKYIVEGALLAQKCKKEKKSSVEKAV